MSDEDIRCHSLNLAARARCDARTAAKALRGGKVLPVVRAALEAAARELGIELPVTTSTASETTRAA